MNSKSGMVTLEQARSMHDNVPWVVWGNLGGALCAFLILFNSHELSRGFLASWFLSFLILAASSFLHRLRTGRENLDEPATASRWFAWYRIHHAILGLLWSLLSVVVMSDASAPYQFAMLAGLAMLAAGAMTSLGIDYPSYRAFLIALLVPTIAVLLAQWMWLHAGMGLTTSLFLAYMFWSGQRFNHSYLDSLRLRFENLGLVRDLTLQKDAAESANQAKSRFLAAASHDLRQPMYALNLYLGAIQNTHLPEDAKELLYNAQQCASAMDDLFSVLLDMSRLDAGAVTPKMKDFPVSNILERIALEFAPPAREKGLELRVVMSSCFIRSDPALAERIVRNFVSNAVRHTRHGVILLGCRRMRHGLRIAVFDTGPGIPEDKLGAVFEEYYQLGNPERDRSKGLGLGLAIVRRLSSLLDTPIALRSKPGRGSMFAADFPYGNAATEEVQAASGSGGMQEDLSGRLIVIIDDEAMIRDALRTLLEQWQCTVLEASAEDEAVERVSVLPAAPDAIICDYRLRDGDNGLDAIEKIRQEFCVDIPALLVTGDTGPDRILEIRANRLSVLHKPLQPDSLREALLSVLSEACPDPDRAP